MPWPIITTDSHHGVPFELADELPEKELLGLTV